MFDLAICVSESAIAAMGERVVFLLQIHTHGNEKGRECMDSTSLLISRFWFEFCPSRLCGSTSVNLEGRKTMRTTTNDAERGRTYPNSGRAPEWCSAVPSSDTPDILVPSGEAPSDTKQDR
jgi:hypothetical protein